MLEFGAGDTNFEALVDSGAMVNTIPSKIWEIMKHSANVSKINEYPREKLTAYASKSTLELECAFEADLYVSGSTQTAKGTKFYVVKGTEVALIGYPTAKALNLLQLGIAQQDAVCTIFKTLEEINAQNQGKFPKIPNVSVKIQTDDSVAQKQIIRYRIPKAMEKEATKRLDAMEKAGIIEKADAEDLEITWVSPMMLVAKGPNDFRLVIDYRHVNKCIVRHPYPMPTMEQIWAQIPQGKDLFFTKLDLSDAFHHIELSEEARRLTTFMTAKGMMRFTRLPFGLSCSPEIFQREMEKIFAGTLGVVIYMDDILVFAESQEELHSRVEHVKEKLRASNMTINEKKSEYDQKSIEFLGMTIDSKGVRPTKSRIADIKNFKRPQNVTELRSFLGLVTFVSPFLTNFSDRTETLRKLITARAPKARINVLNLKLGKYKRKFMMREEIVNNKGQKLAWNDEHQKAFEDLKKAVCDDIIYRGFYSERDETFLYTDASPWGLGATLVQRDAAGSYRIISCASKSLTETERRYPQIQREALAIVWGMEHFIYYLLGKKFTLRADNKPLQHIIEHKKLRDDGKRILSRAEGWFMRLEYFDFKFEHISGESNIADVPSRLVQTGDDNIKTDPKAEAGICSLTTHITPIVEQQLALTNDEVRKEVLSDKSIQLIIEHLVDEGKWPEEIRMFQKFRSELHLRSGVLMKSHKVILPRLLKERALRIAHVGHPGISTMKNVLRQGLWWHRMDADIEEFVKSCPACQLIKESNTPAPIVKTALPRKPFENVDMDLVTTSQEKGWKALVLIDRYSRFLVTAAMTKTDVVAVKNVLTRIFQIYQVPKILKADNGPPFNSLELKAWLKTRWGTDLENTTPLNPTENGLVERAMQGINRIAKAAKLEKRSWQEMLAEYTAAYNSWPHHSTRLPPNTLMFGRRTRGTLPDWINDESQIDDERLRERDARTKERRNLREDKKRGARENPFVKGDKVLVAQKPTDKLDTVYKNARYVVEAVEGVGRLQLREEGTGKSLTRNVKHVKRLRERNVSDEPTDMTEKRQKIADDTESWCQKSYFP